MPLFREEIVRRLGFGFGRGTLQSSSSFRVILVSGASAIADNSTPLQVVKLELKNATDYTRLTFAPDGAAWSDANSRAEFPEESVTVTVTAGSQILNFDGVAVLGTTQTAANGTITSISGDTITLNAHGRGNDEMFFVTSTDTYPTGLPADTIRYVRNSSTNQFQAATTAGGTAISLGTSWSGTLTAHYLGNAKLVGWHVLPEAATLNPGQSRTLKLNFTSDN